MELIGKKVTHKKFGAGKIMEINENKMKVSFKEDIKIFLFPDSFQNFLTIENKDAKDFITQKQDANDLELETKKREQRKKAQATVYAQKSRKSVNSQAVFALKDNNIDEVSTNWTVFTGNHTTGKSKGTPRIPKNMNQNSACILTLKGEKEEEKDRAVVGLFMVSDDFIGEKCLNGMISAHKKHRIIWNAEHEKLLFWDYLPEQSRLNKWGSYEMKYLPVGIVKMILEDMIRETQGEVDQEPIMQFYRYFCNMNRM
ncbi:MAG: hypothetical protein PHP50_11540 [Lachnospiraceae bacterium]|nr:hypothetical protein [Lachnospiraceae bacterium]